MGKIVKLVISGARSTRKGTEGEIRIYIIHTLSSHHFPSFLMAKPQMFQFGDIVETQLSFVMVLLKGKTFNMMTILHSIVLLDSAWTTHLAR